MMWNNEFRNLNELKEFIVNQLNYDETTGFSFVQVPSGMNFENAIELLGVPETRNSESDQQQTLLYSAWIDHHTEGKRDHHKLNALFWSFENEVIEVIRLHADYYKTGEFSGAFYEFINELFSAVMDKFGAPSKKSLRKGKEEISYQRGKHTLLM